MIKNQDIKNLLKHFKYFVPVGSYARNTHLKEYKDLDLLTFKNLEDVLDDLEEYYNDVKILRKGKKHISLLINNNQIDIWRTTKETFYKDYLNRFLITHQVININRFLKL